MTKKAVKYGLMSIAAVLLMVMAFVGAGAAMGGNPVPLTDSSYKVLVVDDVSGEVTPTSGTTLGSTVYLLEDAEDWNTVAVDNTYDGDVLIFADNLDFSSTAADYMMTYPFTGKIYGNGYLINEFTNETESTNNIGLIRTAGDGLYMNYVQMTNSSLYSTSENVGSLIGIIDGSSTTDVVIIGCYIIGGNVTNTGDAGSRVGGLVGYIDGSNASLTLNHTMVLNTTICTRSHSVGGLVGRADESQVKAFDCNVINCWIEGGNSNIAGFIGRAISSYGSSFGFLKCNVENCTIYGKYWSISIYNVGGLLGVSSNASVEQCNVTNCNVTNSNGNVGGMIGSATSTIGKNCTISNCNLRTNSEVIGGLIGGANAGTIIENCTALKCNVYANGGGHVGGIVGTQSGGVFNYCFAGIDEDTALYVNLGYPQIGGSYDKIPTCENATLKSTPWTLVFPTKEESQVFPASKLPYVYVTYNAAPGAVGSPYSSAKQTVDMPYIRNTTFGSIVSGNTVSPVRSGYTFQGWNNAPASVTQNTVVNAIWEDNSPQYTPSSSKQTGSTIILSEGQVAPTAYATSTPTVAPTAAPTEKPATPTVIATEKPTTQATQQSPAPVFGILAGLGAAAAALARLRR